MRGDLGKDNRPSRPAGATPYGLRCGCIPAALRRDPRTQPIAPLQRHVGYRGWAFCVPASAADVWIRPAAGVVVEEAQQLHREGHDEGTFLRDRLQNRAARRRPSSRTRIGPGPAESATGRAAATRQAAPACPPSCRARAAWAALGMPSSSPRNITLDRIGFNKYGSEILHERRTADPDRRRRLRRRPQTPITLFYMALSRYLNFAGGLGLSY